MILLGLRLDEIISWNYFVVFLPLWIWKFIVFFGTGVGTVVWFKHPEYRSENNVDLQAMYIACGFHIFVMLFELLLSMNLEYEVVPYRIVFIPIYCMSVLAVVACVWGYRHERQLELESFFSVNILQFICVSLKWDNVIDWSWVVVFVPAWIILTLLSVAVLYYIIWALLFMRSPEITPTQRKGHVINAFMSCAMVIPLLCFMVMLSRKLDGYSTSYYLSVFLPLYISLVSLVITSFRQKGGNQWWFGLRKEFCEFLLDLFPLLREYGNVSYKFSDAILTEANSDSSINSTSSAYHKRQKDNKPLVGNVMYIDMPD